jgi:N-methylhydantoinase B
MDGIQVHVTNTSNLPVEALENEYPLLVEEYGLVANSGGAGTSRGGLGITRQIRALEDGRRRGRSTCRARTRACDRRPQKRKVLIGSRSLRSG